MLETILAAVVVLGLGVLGMFVFLLKKGGEFPKYDVGSNPEMRKRGIRCFKDEDAELHRTRCDGNYSEACKECGLFDEKTRKKNESGSNSRPA